MGLFLLCFPDESVGPNEGLVAEAISGGISECGWAILDSGHGYAAAWDFAFKGEGFRHCWWAFDYDGYSGWAFDYDGYTGWALDYDHGSYAAAYKGRGCDRAQSRARAVQEPAEAYPSSPIDGGHQSRCPYPCAWPDSRIEGGSSTSSHYAVGSDVAAVPPGAEVMVKAMPPPPTPTPISIPDVVVKAMPVAPPGIVVKSTMHPPLPVAAAMATAPAMASVIALAPASSKAEAISLATEPVHMEEDAATEEASPITPPHPLVELGTRAPGTPSAFGVAEPWTDPDDISEQEAVSEAATVMSAEDTASAVTAMSAEDAAAALAMPAEGAAVVTAMSAEDAAELLRSEFEAVKPSFP